MGILVTVTLDAVLSALPDVELVDKGRELDGAELSDGAVFVGGVALGATGSDARTELPKGVGEEVTACADGDTLGAVGRNFLLERSVELADCQERLWDKVAPDAVDKALAGEAYFWRVSCVG